MARLLRIAAIAFAVLAAAVVVVPFLIMWWADDPPSDPVSGPVLFTHYFVHVPAFAGFLVVAGIVALVLIALARIIDRLDAIQRRASGCEDAAT